MYWVEGGKTIYSLDSHSHFRVLTICAFNSAACSRPIWGGAWSSWWHPHGAACFLNHWWVWRSLLYETLTLREKYLPSNLSAWDNPVCKAAQSRLLQDSLGLQWRARRHQVWNTDSEKDRIVSLATASPLTRCATEASSLGGFTGKHVQFPMLFSQWESTYIHLRKFTVHNPG